MQAACLPVVKIGLKNGEDFLGRRPRRRRGVTHPVEPKATAYTACRHPTLKALDSPAGNADRPSTLAGRSRFQSGTNFF
jgi:hypothetical protein